MANNNTPPPDESQATSDPVADLFPEDDPSGDDQATDAAIDDIAGGVSEVEQLRQELNDANDRVLRAQAELENFRKRSRRELADTQRYASLRLIGELLTVVDNLGRAIDAADQEQHTSGLLEGVKMVQQHLQTILEQHNCTVIEAVGQPFDPNRHEAILQQPSDDVPAGCVTQVARCGYQLHDRVVRPTQVLVSTGPATTEPSE